MSSLRNSGFSFSSFCFYSQRNAIMSGRINTLLSMSSLFTCRNSYELVATYYVVRGYDLRARAGTQQSGE